MSDKKYNKYNYIKTILLVFLFFLLVYTAYITYQIRLSDQSTTNIFNETPEKQFVLITDDLDSYSHQKFIEGVETASESFNIVYQIKYIEDNLNIEEIEDAFNVCIYTKVDGIVLKLSNNDLAMDFILLSENSGIPVITVGNDSVTSQRSAYIGTNQYNLGQTVGELIETDESGDNILIVFDFNFIGKKGSATNNYLNGILSVLNENYNLSIRTLFLEEDQRVESLLKDYINYDKPDYIITTDPINSLRVTKALVDLNEIGKIKIIASSNHPDILNYLQKGTILASAIEDYTLMGNSAITALYNLGSSKSSSAYTAVPFTIMTKETVGDSLDD